MSKKESVKVNNTTLDVPERMKPVIDTLSLIGFELLRIGKTNENGPDIWAVKDGRPYSVEVKHVKPQRTRCAQVRPVEHARKRDDLIAIVFPNSYVLVEPMKDHLMACSAKGYRNITGLI